MAMYSSESPLAATPHHMEQGHIGSYGAYIPDKGLLAPVHPELLGYGGRGGRIATRLCSSSKQSPPRGGGGSQDAGFALVSRGYPDHPSWLPFSPLSCSMGLAPWSFLGTTDTCPVESLTVFRWALGTPQRLGKRVREEKQDLGTSPTPSHKVHSEGLFIPATVTAATA